MTDGSNKEADNAVPNNTAQETQYNESEEGASQSKEDQIVAEVCLDHKNIGSNYFLVIFKI